MWTGGVGEAMIIPVLIIVAVIFAVAWNRITLSLIPKRKTPLTGMALYNWKQRRGEHSMSEGRHKRLVKNIEDDASYFIPPVLGTTSNPQRNVMKPAMFQQVLIRIINIQKLTEERLQELEGGKA